MNNFDNQLVKPESWFTRNWKWALPLGCLSTIGLFVVGIILFGIIGFSKIFNGNNDVKSKAIDLINNEQVIVQQLGSPIDSNGMMQGAISTTNDGGNADISVPLKGPNGTGTTFIKAVKVNDEWNYERIAVQIDKTNEIIEIRKKY
ncbi:cytochrome c oxidase assembly factor Coa1 family protein [Faecalibacter rhinopitheci]|uniref:Cytochrome oxidase complex assembly protein 1 n=1 Tax=Faecalibacter rhinopitheci TaxID=2779678 RepID=A0A8J7FY11_9FLAO|nr:cytochrome c oxidase assembly factor Coa1 family protein [Faecalibacter rhinopitheci]MBF0597753.1 hypothetical protein [Faecalibacter rhinopitheci]